MKQILVTVPDDLSTPPFFVWCQDDRSDLMDHIAMHLTQDRMERDHLHGFSMDASEGLFWYFVRDEEGPLFVSDQHADTFRPDLIARFAGNDEEIESYTRACTEKNVVAFFGERRDYLAIYEKNVQPYLTEVFCGYDGLYEPRDIPWPDDMYAFIFRRYTEVRPEYVTFSYIEMPKAL